MTPGPGLQKTILPLGFFAGGINSGVRRYRPDLGIIFSENDLVAAGVYTLNQCQAAPVKYSAALTPSASIRAIVTNSGQANAATGELGEVNNLRLVTAVAKKLDVDKSQVLVASTGVIGVQMEIDKIESAIPEMCDRANEIAESFALAILTTDLVPKTVTTTVELSGGVVRITGICKGSGMIHPNMATMLGYLLTDAELTVDQAQGLLKESTDVSFNMISVDGDCSTNDCSFLLASGATKIGLQTELDLQLFKKALVQVSQFLAQSIAADGEGASKLLEVRVKGLLDKGLAKQAARGITMSPLIKTAMHGEDPNWGRILARLGAEQVPGEALAKMDLRVQGELLFQNGAPVAFDRAEVKAKLKTSKIEIEVDLKSGPEMAVAWGCDLSKKYVEINTEYS